MRPEHIGVLVEGVIPFLGGIYATLLGFRVVGPKPGVNPRTDDWHRRWGRFMRLGGPLIVVFGFFLWVKGIISHPGSDPAPVHVWKRHSTSDGTVSVEFPAAPRTVTKDAGGVMMHNVTLSDKDRDRHFILSWSEVAGHAGLADEELLDSLRESFPAMSAQQGTQLTFVSEERFTESAVTGRVFVFHGNGNYTLRMKCLILNGRFYRATATTPRTPNDEADGVRFVSTLQIEKAAK
jgi:hypothetical protein